MRRNILLLFLERAKQALKNSGAKLRSLIADSQYSDSKLRNAVGKATIPYPANHMKGVEGLLRVDRKFRTYGPEDQKKEYHKRPPIEAVNSFLKTQCSMAANKVRGLKQVASYALFSIFCLVLNRKHPKHRKIRQSSFTNLLQCLITGQGRALIFSHCSLPRNAFKFITQ